ncbi:hypothetical protein GCM10011583_55330 [Streptomyces camponoticapitis]|uniref:Uncharacterized protein n=1 Tax=Streptomyces camponoticapitis TaxID=1616125 RepID=A0ABQ2ELT9_9ACTN|nr:hypothetical protein [Streptomyces camponoticapitis]GGK16350.1 hypothetical protein GCM10011583_55330 [Streptomyces camponoticapitis]
MDATATALLVTVVGAAMTTVTALLTQSRIDRSRREERREAGRRQLEERCLQERQELLGARRSEYAALNTSARQYLTALSDHAHALGRGAGAETGVGASADLEETRAAYRDCYSQLQLTLPEPLLESVRSTNRSLNAIYGVLMRINHGMARTGETVDDVKLHIAGLWSELGELRAGLRADLAD